MVRLNLVKKKIDFSFCDNNYIDGNIAFCADSNYISYVGIAINSIIKNSTGKYCFHIFTKNIKIEELLSALNRKEEEKEKNTVLWVLAIIGAVAAVAGIAFAVYHFFAPDYLEDFEEDFDDDFDDYFEDEEE